MRLILLQYLVVFFVLLITDQSNLKRLIPFSVSSFFGLFLIEVVAVKTGVLFGDFYFGQMLGPKVLETPVLIGWNWLMILYCATILSQRYTDNRYFISFLTAVLMVIYDFVLERPAGFLEMWHWSGKYIPMQNFLAWFVLSWALSGGLQLLRIRLKNTTATTLLFAQLIFYFLLNLVFYVENSVLV